MRILMAMDMLRNSPAAMPMSVVFLSKRLGRRGSSFNSKGLSNLVGRRSSIVKDVLFFLTITGSEFV